MIVRRATLYTLISAVLWGTTFPAITFGLRHGAGPFTFAFLRFVLAVASLGVLLLVLRRFDLRFFRDKWVWALGLAHGLGYAGQFAAQSLTTASKTSLLVDINVVFVALLGVFVLREPITRRLGLSIVAGTAGVVLLATQGDLGSARWSEPEFLGDALALLAGVIWAVYFVGLKTWLDRNPGADGLALTFAVLAVTALCLAIPAFSLEGSREMGDASAVAMIVYLGLGATTVAFWLWQEALRTQAATATSVLLLFEIVVAVGISLAFLDERINAWGVVGAGLILVAAYGAASSESRAQPVEASTSPA